MKKSILYSTLGILGSVGAAGVAVSAVYYTKYKNLKDGLDFSGSRVKINMYESLDDITPVSKIYEVKKNETDLADLMLNYKNDFIFDPKDYGAMGRMVWTIFGVEAKFKNGFWWQVASPTYVIDHPGSLNAKSNLENSLNIGISSIILKNSQVVNFYKTPA